MGSKGAQNGSERRAMANHRTLDTKAGQKDLEGKAAQKSQRRSQRNTLDSADGSALERSFESIPSIPNLPSVVPTMGKEEGHGPNFESLGRGFEATGKAGFIGMLHRCHLLGGKKTGLYIGPTKRGKGTKIKAIADRNGLPVALHIESASRHETKLVKGTLDNRFVAEKFIRLVGDKAYDSDKLDAELRKMNIRLIAPHRSNRVKAKTQDGRELRRYKRRWKVERLFAWMHNFRRVVTRWEFKASNFDGFVKLACVMILLRKHF